MVDVASTAGIETKVEELRRLMEEIHSISSEIRGKALQLTSTSAKPYLGDAKNEAPEATIATEFRGALVSIRGVLQEALEVLCNFV